VKRSPTICPGSIATHHTSDGANSFRVAIRLSRR
jgi:hypothetical protein